MRADLVGLPTCMNVFCSNEERLGHFMEYWDGVKPRVRNERKAMVTLCEHRGLFTVFGWVLSFWCCLFVVAPSNTYLSKFTI